MPDEEYRRRYAQWVSRRPPPPPPSHGPYKVPEDYEWKAKSVIGMRGGKLVQRSGSGWFAGAWPWLVVSFAVAIMAAEVIARCGR
jgi:hypothetical protein